MKIPIKYGLMTAAGAVVWVLIARLLTNPASIVYTLGSPIFFNILHFAMIYLGLKALEREKNEKPIFKEGLKTGVWISFVYALTVSLFFVGVILSVGTQWFQSEAAPGEPLSQVAAKAFTALFVGAMVLGLIYSTMLSFFLAKRQSDEN